MYILEQNCSIHFLCSSWQAVMGTRNNPEEEEKEPQPYQWSDKTNLSLGQKSNLRHDKHDTPWLVLTVQL